MPADPSSPIPSGLSPLCGTDPLRPTEPPDLLAYLATIPDPRARTGRRHPLVAILGLAAAAVLAGARSMVAIAEWAADAPQPVLAALGARRDPLTGRFAVPAEATIRRTLARLDAEALAAVVGAWLSDRAGRDHHDRWRRAAAVDGKTLRGARYPPDGRQVHLLAAMDHATRAVLAHIRSAARPRRCRPSPRCWSPLTWPARWSPSTRSRPTRRPPSSWRPASRPLPVHGQGQPAHPASPLCWLALASRARAGPQPRPGTRPG